MIEDGALSEIRAQIAKAVAAPKCHRCACFHSTLDALERSSPEIDELTACLGDARSALVPPEYECLACPECFPALAGNAFVDAFPTQTEGFAACAAPEPESGDGWPPLPGDYHVVRYRAPVAVCCLNSDHLATQMADYPPQGLAIIGTLRTENLGIERMIRNVLGNPHIRFLILCGEDTRRAVGHQPGQSMKSLFEGGIDDDGRIRGARGKRPFLKNVTREQVRAFVRQVELVDSIGERELSAIAERVRECDDRNPGAIPEARFRVAIDAIQASEPRRLVLDPAGFFVICADTRYRRFVAEHYSTLGQLDCVIEGKSATSVYGEIIKRNLVSRLDHAAYLGKELTRAEQSMQTGEPYVQDRAPGTVAPPARGGHSRRS